ncbi:MAG: nucleotidyltransferase family protein [Candidatus Omnitrophica bacterium]|nr:nucleotidyltransferase family protein [Candidatus Omnitrophota bacterium]
MSVILLAGGYGTRLYPLTKDKPKALLPIGSKLLLDWILEALRSVAPLGEIVLVTNGRFAGQFEAWRNARGLSVQIVNDQTMTNETRLGAIQDLQLARTRMPASDDLLVLGTDNLFTWSLAEFVRFAGGKRPCATIGVWELASAADARRFGIVRLDPEGRIAEFLEKPAQPPTRLAALCVYYLPVASQPRLAQFLQAGGNPDAPGFFIEWMTKQDAVYAFMTQGEWFDIGSIESYEQASRRWMELTGSSSSGPSAGLRRRSA